MNAQKIGFAVSVFVAAVLILAFLMVIGYSTDFLAFYTAGRIVLNGDGSKLFDYRTQLQIERRYTDAPVPYYHAAPEALLFLPFAALNYPTAYLFWAVANLLFFGVCIHVLRSWFLRLSLYDLLLLAGAVLIPFLAALSLGQDSFLSLTIYALSFKSFDKGEEVKSGSLLGLGLFKPQLVLPFLVLALARRRFRAAAGFLATAAGFILTSFAVVGVKATLAYPALLLKLNQKSVLASYYVEPHRMPNLRGLAWTLFSDRIDQLTFNLGVAVVSLLLILWSATRAKKDAAVDFSLCLLATLLVSWHFHLHDLVLLMIPALLLLAETELLSRWGLFLRASLVLTLVLEVIPWAALARIQFSGICVPLLLLLWGSGNIRYLKGAERKAT